MNTAGRLNRARAVGGPRPAHVVCTFLRPALARGQGPTGPALSPVNSGWMIIPKIPVGGRISRWSYNTHDLGGDPSAHISVNNSNGRELHRLTNERHVYVKIVRGITFGTNLVRAETADEVPAHEGGADIQEYSPSRNHRGFYLLRAKSHAIKPIQYI